MAHEVIQTFRDLHAWQASIELRLLAYDLAKRFPPTERFGLSAEIRRSAVSIPSNVAEGQCSGTPRSSLCSWLEPACFSPGQPFAPPFTPGNFVLARIDVVVRAHVQTSPDIGTRMLPT
jgi:hypothetical protein